MNKAEFNKRWFFERMSFKNLNIKTPTTIFKNMKLLIIECKLYVFQNLHLLDLKTQTIYI